MKQVSKSEFTADVNAGMRRDELISKYGITNADVTKILQSLELRIKRTKKATFELV